MRKFLLTGTAVLFMTAVLAVADKSSADEAKKVKLPVTAKLVAKETKYKIDLGGRSADEFKKALPDQEKSGKTPTPPAVDMVLEITNTSDKEVKIWEKGDPVFVALKLEGPGAVSAKPNRATTLEFRSPVPTTLAPGKTLSIPVKSLTYGFRGNAQQVYWTEPGEYTLTATFQTGINPAPDGLKANPDGFAPVGIVSEPVKVTVEK